MQKLYPEDMKYPKDPNKDAMYKSVQIILMLDSSLSFRMTKSIIYAS